MRAEDIGPALVEFAQAWRESHATVRQALAIVEMEQAAEHADRMRRTSERMTLAGLDRAADLERALWRGQLAIVEFFRTLAAQAGEEMDATHPEIRAAWRREGAGGQP